MEQARQLSHKRWVQFFAADGEVKEKTAGAAARWVDTFYLDPWHRKWSARYAGCRGWEGLTVGFCLGCSRFYLLSLHPPLFV